MITSHAGIFGSVGGPTPFVFDVSTAVYSGNSKSTAPEDNQPWDIWFKPDGTSIYVVSTSTGDYIWQYNLSVAWDMSTATYSGNNHFLSGSGNARSLAFNSTGTKSFSFDANQSVYEYNLSTAWDASTGVASGVSFSVSSQETIVYGMTFSLDGTKMYITGIGGVVYQYTLTTPWLLSSASYANKSKSISAQAEANGVKFLDSGETMITVANTTDYAYQYNLSTAWDVSTAVYSNNSKSIQVQDNDPKGLAFDSIGTNMYMIGIQNDTIWQYTL